MRVTEQMLDSSVSVINMFLCQGKREHYISAQNGGFALYKVCTRGQVNVFETNHIPKKELYNLMNAFIRGITAVNAL